jgi:hypothetical protein
MKIYRASCWELNLGCLVSWHSSKDKADSWIQENRDNPGFDTGPHGVTAVDFPKTKREIIDWLNRNLSTDNG